MHYVRTPDNPPAGERKPTQTHDTLLHTDTPQRQWVSLRQRTTVSASQIEKRFNMKVNIETVAIINDAMKS
ncbi:hypothetical protein Clacol_001749 [Clathrus columnatus]|uniref:Uncharacterized protein n=1 Tax=Clathrus columnatus TaxID=1419009 RepID=A0AAV4ZYY3_9AGAM|nr:hypothetical protein Clacol_001749 [Clathrus columnatus]